MVPQGLCAWPRSLLRPKAIDPVGLKFPLAGSYRSAESRKPTPTPALMEAPPATRTLPLASRVALNSERGVSIFPVSVNLPVAGS